MEEARKLCLNHAQIKHLLDVDKVVVAGFSFGAATAGIVASTNPAAYKAAMLIDGCT